jgi:hypothetical protein
MSCPNVKECLCPNTGCANHGTCCACVANHRNGGSVPLCLRPKTEKGK